MIRGDKRSERWINAAGAFWFINNETKETNSGFIYMEEHKCQGFESVWKQVFASHTDSSWAVEMEERETAQEEIML